MANRTFGGRQKCTNYNKTNNSENFRSKIDVGGGLCPPS